MPVYNAGRYVKEAIQSILDQTFKNFELIIINDGSTDNSAEVIRSINDPRIRYIENPSNLGIIATRNKGLDLAQGEYLACMDADDISMPNRLQRQVDYLDQHPEISILASRLLLVDPENNITGIWPEDYYCIDQDLIARTLPVINCIGQPTVMMRTVDAKRIAYNPKFKANEDWGLWLNALSSGLGIAKLPDILLRYRQHSSNTTVTANKLGVEKKILRFKRLYLLDKLPVGFKATEKKVLKSYFKDLIRFGLKALAPRIYTFIGRLQKVKLSEFLKQRKAAADFFKKARPDMIYVFPFYHTGGAERVHASIMEVLGKQKDAVSLITDRSDNDAFLKKMSEYSTVLEISELLKLGFSERWLFKKINKLCAENNNCQLFGSNAQFLYNVIPHLPASAKVTDLLHAFVHDYEEGPEKWSLPVISRLSDRVVINRKTKSDLEALYKRSGISADYLSRIRVIPNFVEEAFPSGKDTTGSFNVAYVGRAGEEKRVDLIAQFGKKLHQEHPEIRFHFVGNIKSFLPPTLQEGAVFHGEITDEAQLAALYDTFQVLVIASTREGFPMVIMEAMMHGVVPVSTDVGGIPEHVRDAENGLLIADGPEDQLRENFQQKIKYLYLNRTEWSRMSANARTYALQHFGRRSFEEAYRSLLLNKK